MKLNKIIVAMGAMAIFVGVAHADGSTTSVTVTGGIIRFKGDLVSAPCAASTSSSDQTVKLGEYTTHHFSKLGVEGTLKPFQIKLLLAFSSRGARISAIPNSWQSILGFPMAKLTLQPV